MRKEELMQFLEVMWCLTFVLLCLIHTGLKVQGSSNLTSYIGARQTRAFSPYHEHNDSISNISDPSLSSPATLDHEEAVQRIRRQTSASNTSELIGVPSRAVAPGSEEAIPTTIPNVLRNDLIVWLNTTRASFQREPGKDIEMICDMDIVKGFEQEFPKLRLQWTVDGKPVCADASRFLVRTYSFIMESLNYQDSGLYECRIEFGKHVLTANFFALTIQVDYATLRSRLTEPLKLDCNSDILVMIIRNTDYSATVSADGDQPDSQKSMVNESELIYRQWFHNDTRASLLPARIPAIKPAPDVIPDATYNMSGTWACHVVHVPTNRTWITRWHRVYITDPPSALELWWRKVLRYPEVVAVVGLLLLFAFIGTSILIALKAQKHNVNLEEQYQRLKQRIARRPSKLRMSRTRFSSMVGVADVEPYMKHYLDSDWEGKWDEETASDVPGIIVSQTSISSSGEPNFPTDLVHPASRSPSFSPSSGRTGQAQPRQRGALRVTISTTEETIRTENHIH